ncbi:DUF2254 family protein [Caldicellulosiruptoraceae bacterium PP1]
MKLKALGRGKSLLSSILIIAIVYIFCPEIFSNDPNTARYLLNTIATSLTTIFAISISVIMIAVQLTSAKLTHKIIEYFTKFKWNYILLMFFFTTIIHTTFMLALVNEGLGSNRFVRKGINFDIFMFVICLGVLILYIYNVFEILKPNNILKIILKELEKLLQKDKIDEALKYLDMIYDISKKSSNKLDTTTSVEGLRLISNLYIDNRFYDKRYEKIFEDSINHLLSATSICIRAKDDEAFKAIISNLQIITNKLIENRMYKDIEIIIDAYQHILLYDLIGYHNLGYVKIITDEITNIYIKLFDNIENHEVQQLFIKAFNIFHTISKEIIDLEPTGLIFICDEILINCFGKLIEIIIDNNKADLLYWIIGDYYHTVKSFIENSEMENITKYLEWFRKILITNQKDNVNEYLEIYFVITALSLYLKKQVVFVSMIRNIARLYSLSKLFLKEIIDQRKFYRIFFDFTSTTKYFINTYFIWNGYAKVKNLKNIKAKKNLNFFDNFTIDDFSTKRLFYEGKFRCKKIIKTYKKF